MSDFVLSPNCLARWLEEPASLDELRETLEPFCRQTAFVYLDMVGSTHLKNDLRQNPDNQAEDIFQGFHRVMRAVEDVLSTSQAKNVADAVLTKESRVGDALLFTFKSEMPNDPDAFRRSLLDALTKLQALPRKIAEAAQGTVLRDHVLEFRAGLHFGEMHIDHIVRCDPLTAQCLTATELISYDLDVVTKVANLSRWDSKSQHLYPAISKPARKVLIDSGGAPIAESLADYPVAVVEDEYKGITSRLYLAAGETDIYSVVDFSVFDKEILAAIGESAGKLHMTGWLVSAREAPLGALLRKAIAPKLDLRLARLPDPLLTKSHIVGPNEALVGQTFSFGGGRHFLVGEHRLSEGAMQLYNSFQTLWNSQSHKLSPAIETNRSLRELATEAADGKTELQVSDIDEEWVMKLTGLTRESCANRMKSIRRAEPFWEKSIVDFVNRGD